MRGALRTASPVRWPGLSDVGERFETTVEVDGRTAIFFEAKRQDTRARRIAKTLARLRDGGT